jgi:hypothetical protein
MKLDRNINADGRGKYALVKLRRVDEISAKYPSLSLSVMSALRFLEAEGILDYGTTPETEFFTIRLKDVNAPAALNAYGISATVRGDPEYGGEIEQMARRSGENHPNCKRPD